jgi:hypothetical protein
MKNRKSLYILIPLVIVVWGLIFWRFFSATNSDPKPNFSFQDKSYAKDTSALSFDIKADYPDPFFWNKSSYLNPVEKESKNNNIQSFAQASISNMQDKPNLKYFGCIVCENRKTGLVEINNKKYLVKENSKQENLIIMTIWEDSLIIKVNEVRHTYFKQN